MSANSLRLCVTAHPSTPTGEPATRRTPPVTRCHAPTHVLLCVSALGTLLRVCRHTTHARTRYVPSPPATLLAPPPSPARALSLSVLSSLIEVPRGEELT